MFRCFTGRTINVIWRSRNSPCETLSSPLHVRVNQWTHIAVIFSPFEPDVDINEMSRSSFSEHSFLGEGAYPAIISLYINGRLVASKSQVRFFSDVSIWNTIPHSLEIPNRCDWRRCEEPGFAEGETVYADAAGSEHRAIGYTANL